MKKLKKITNWKTTIINFLKNNSKEYLLVIIIFIIGMFIGVMLVNILLLKINRLLKIIF